MGVWRAVGGGYAGEAELAEVSVFAVLEPAVVSGEMVPQTSQSVGGGGWPEGLWASSDRVLPLSAEVGGGGFGRFAGFCFPGLSTGMHAGVLHVFMCGAE